MLAIVNGVRGGTIKYPAGSDKTINIIILDDDGAPVDVTGDTVSVEVYANANRSDTPTTNAGALTAPSAGHVNSDFADDGDIAGLTKGKSYFMWVKHTAAGGTVTYLNDAPFILSVV